MENSKKSEISNENKINNNHFHTHTHSHLNEEENNKNNIFVILGIILFLSVIILSNMNYINETVKILLYVITYILIGFDIFLNAIKHLFRKDMFDENFLMTIATIGAFCIGEYTEAVAVLLFYKIGEYLQDLAVNNSRKKIIEVVNLKPEYAFLDCGNSLKKVRPEEVKVDDIIVIKNGEKIPLDGTIIVGQTTVDTSMLTGESCPKEVSQNEKVLSGYINLGSVIKVKVEKTYEKSAVYKIVEIIENSVSKKSKTERFITKFSKIYTPIVTALALIILLILPIIFNVSFDESLKRALSFLVVSCPCALVLSIPLAFFIGIGTSSKKGILVKGGNYLERLAKVNKVIFDKTGTLTNGDFKVVEIVSKSNNFSKEEILEYICSCEKYSNHYLAKSIIAEYDSVIDTLEVSEHEEISGMGIRCKIKNDEVLVGNEKILNKYEIDYEKVNTDKSVIHIAINKEYIGYIIMSDSIKEESADLIERLKKIGVSETILLTGDSENISLEIAEKLKIDKVYSKLLPEEKLKKYEEIKCQSDKEDIVVYIGDGINDGPVIAASDVGIAMGNGSDISMDVADVVLVNNKIDKIIDCIKIAKKTKEIATQNILLVLSVKIIFLSLSTIGLTTMWEAVFADVGISLIAIFNSLRIAKYK